MDLDTVTATIEDLRQRGFTDHFMVRGRQLVAIDAGRPFLPRDVVIREYHRFEGVSDPDDMAIVYALESREGTKGVLTDAFGAYSDPAVGAMLDILRIEPGKTTARSRAGAPTA
jgi:hypothetical protein